MINKTNTVNSVIRGVLDTLDIDYRELPCKSETLWFCSANGCTFDLQFKDEKIRIWRFIDTAHAGRESKRYVCCKKSDSDKIIGVKTTKDGDVVFYAEKKLEVDAIDLEITIRKMITGYISAISAIANSRF